MANDSRGQFGFGLIAIAACWLAVPARVDAQIGGMIRGAVSDQIQRKIDDAVSCAFNDQECIKKAKEDGKPVKVTDAKGKKVSSADSAKAMASANASAPSDQTTSTAAAPSFKTYQNYDFVPGDKIVFEDDFTSDQDGEFPAHWKLLKGQGVVNKVQGEPSLTLTEGNYVRVAPRVKTARYLDSSFTVEFDFYKTPGSYETGVFLDAGEKSGQAWFGADPSTGGFDNDFNGRYPGGDDAEAFANKWHHAALIVKNGQLKMYVDQYRVLVMPDMGNFRPESIEFGGIGDPDHPLVFRNVRIANGGSMNMIDRLTRDGRIITHGITFDVNKSTVKPQSMGTIRQIVDMMNANPALKIEIDGHTDSDGDAAKNMTLSQARADAVKQVLVDQGVAAGRMTTKGYGATKPVTPNDTPEGKANNRRVELVKVP